jgi:metallo-beta-lactamase family protein
MLTDSARIREEDEQTAALLAGLPPSTPRADARRAVERLEAVPYDMPLSLGSDIELRFGNAGHILGSATVLLTMANGFGERRLLFTGDLGRRGLPYLPEPAPLPAADVIVSESTYGGRRHDDLATMARKMGELVRAATARGGKVLIPAFSLGRTQTVVHYLRRWMHEGVLPLLPILIDSPLASQVADVYDHFPDALVDHVHDDAPAAHYVAPDVALEASISPEPCIIVASGGMCEGGRVIHHLRYHVDDPRSVIVLVSYQAPHSLGARLLEKSPSVHFHGKKWNKWIEVASMNGFSGHADHEDLLHLLRPLANGRRRVCLVHGEQHAAEALAGALKPFGFGTVRIPERAEMMAM